MSVFLRVPLGFLIMAIGVLMVWKTVWFQDIIGVIDWAEEKIGSGGTNSFLKILGIIIIFIGIATVTNIISDILTDFAGLFIRT
ncbi:hypothetical protein CO172_02620 [Candidatus Uhrbacteria bacterium CG_4_9_14_3_um_filter_36_7]|uniref:Uncharacterized protein n=1 Tax=Candidatus Uhrbacteria bacterium CG_4_9_14_3_um_filter_36_7 TaxID=1975033 RepID=A0A2M7XH67_9BACT|nr:MAG: hypothetical protein CO172_02620 [Candidatus Uhrbacteria bacterium CG_4_9_14_3_um_filter_36_7]